MAKAKVSVAAAAREAKRENEAARRVVAAALLQPPDGRQRTKADLHAGTQLGAATADSFVNFAHKLGVGADNALTSGTYGYNPVTRNRILLEWIYRGSWLGGVAVDVIADDMTRAGVDFLTEMEPGDANRLEAVAEQLGVWDKMNSAIKWGRLYGGALAVALVDGQDPKTPLRPETVGRDKFKGLLVLDRWMVEPSLSDLVDDYGPFLGMPKLYKVMANAPALKGQTVHFSRVVGRFVGIELPYQQSLTENLWGISVLERLYDRMLAFDSASTGAAQLVFKAHLRTLAIEGFRDIVSAGGAMLEGVVKYTEMMRRFQGIEGITLIDSKDTFEVQQSSAFSGVDQVIRQLAEQVSGALQIPLTRLFGQSPGGMSGGNDEGGERAYYDGIRQKQRKSLGAGTELVYRLVALSEGIELPEDFGVDFASLYQMDDTEKADIASKVTETVSKAKDGGLISDQVALKELRQSSRTTGIFTNITQDLIDAADDMVMPPLGEQELDANLASGEAQEGFQGREQDRADMSQLEEARSSAMPQPGAGKDDLGKGKTRDRRRARPEG